MQQESGAGSKTQNVATGTAHKLNLSKARRTRSARVAPLAWRATQLVITANLTWFEKSD
jgi:hypothetical protein